MHPLAIAIVTSEMGYTICHVPIAGIEWNLACGDRIYSAAKLSTGDAVLLWGIFCSS
jgi:hypothetical protein